MRFPNRVSGIKFAGLLAIIILVVSTPGCMSSGSDKNNSSSSPNVEVIPPAPESDKSNSSSSPDAEVIAPAPEASITFVTTGSSFSPIITVTGNPEIKWVFGDGSTSDSPAPTVNFASKGTRSNTLVVTPWSAVTKINIGYDGSDGGVTPGPGTIENLEQQNVIAVTGLENVAPYLQVWASSYNPIAELDFSNFTELHTIECFYCISLTSIRLSNVPSLTRLCLERCKISYLDLSEAPALADLRGASQRSSTYTINWGTTGANMWHVCIGANPRMTGALPSGQFPVLEDYFVWNGNQSGTLCLDSKYLYKVRAYDNHYSAADLSGCFPAGRRAVVQIYNNELTSLDISDDPGLIHLNASRNSLDQTAVDGVLQTLDSYNTHHGYLDLSGNAAPSTTGIAHANNLTARGWEVQSS
ncbi:hypothetical protein MSMTP_1350 [Methanosarcina sp. MTP4]|uniref:hypothetical protein n=1 Tax=Methanosarcina sp. MTP4 TaxID=1434100 RepID=UPI000615BEF1|nr:hypothetical protein [Methanosarcina sp. MTP4]AKB24819.1 hypothetical protein MSMTP_1350 [Methanosarcina sp. MTP4]